MGKKSHIIFTDGNRTVVCVTAGSTGWHLPNIRYIQGNFGFCVACFGLYWIWDSMSVEREFRILVISEISDFLEPNSEAKAQDSGIRITLFRTIGITWPTSKEISIILFCCAVLEIKARNKT